MICIEVLGQPQGKGRARAFKMKSGAIGHYTPEKTRTYEGMIRTQAIHQQAKKVEGPVQLVVTMYFDVPRSWPEWKRRFALMGEIAPTAKPDSDNVLKAVKDALNGVIWRDDCQVVTTYIRKMYAENPRVLIEIAEINALPAQIKRKLEIEDRL